MNTEQIKNNVPEIVVGSALVICSEMEQMLKETDLPHVVEVYETTSNKLIEVIPANGLQDARRIATGVFQNTIHATRIRLK